PLSWPLFMGNNPSSSSLSLQRRLYAALLGEVPEDILCFSRSFEDLTCFWDEEEEEDTSGKCRFYYWYSREVPKACAVSTQSRGASGMRHVCVFPSQDVRLFSQLSILVVNATSNQTKYSRELSVDTVGESLPWCSTHTAAAGPSLGSRMLLEPHSLSSLVTLDPSRQHIEDSSVLQARSTQVPTPEGAAASPGAGWVLLRDLRPGGRYHIQVRSKPDGLSMDGMWGPWSQAVAAETPHSSGDIGLLCTTPDLQHVRCEWSWDPADASSSHELFYRAPQSRAAAWQRCEAVSMGAQGTHACTFQPRAGSAISVLVNVTWPHARPTLSYFREPFWLHQAESRVPCLQWVPPLEELAEQLAYQLRYSVENSHDWKVLQVPRAARKEVLDLRPGARYLVQVRAQPSGPWYQGNWSAWSKPVVVDATADAGLSTPSRGLFPGRLNWGLPLTPLFFPPSSVKQKLWPPVPDLHRALGNFLSESSKHSQVRRLQQGPQGGEQPWPQHLPVTLSALQQSPLQQSQPDDHLPSLPPGAGEECTGPREQLLSPQTAHRAQLWQWLGSRDRAMEAPDWPTGLLKGHLGAPKMAPQGRLKGPNMAPQGHLKGPNMTPQRHLRGTVLQEPL
uniref:MPL proto-oncogene, thrombopoietin receptor n=1 Tax=Dromaius novaehollandiae TaxID=8790 RepID=A0A8C4J1C2_DRONO